MFTNKRQLKKYINQVGCDMAQFVLPAAVITNKISNDKAEQMLLKVSELQAQAHARLAISFDKAPEAFDSIKAYHAARRAYYKKAYLQALTEYEDGIEALIKEINK